MHDDMATQTSVWLVRVRFRAIWFGMVHFSASYANLRQPHIYKCQNFRQKKPHHACE